MLVRGVLAILFSTHAPSPQIAKSLSVRADHSLSELLTVLDRVSFWISPRRRWEESRGDTIAGVLVGFTCWLPPGVLSQACSNHTVSVASTSLAVALCSPGSGLLSFSTAAPYLPSQKWWVGLRQQQLLLCEGPGLLLPSALQAGSCPLTHTPGTLLHVHTHTHSHSLSTGFLSRLLCGLAARLV